MAQANELLQQKREHICAFNSMLDDSDENADPGRHASTEAMRVRRRAPQKQSNDPNNNSLPRSVSDTNLIKADKQRLAIVEPDSGPPSSTAGTPKPPASLTTRHTFSGSPGKMASSMAAHAAGKPVQSTGKRKRGAADVIQMPEDQQVFRDMVFYFFPNSEANPARKLRINKARQFGATWHKDYDAAVTHVIVDKAMDFTSLTKYLKMETLPPNVAVVSEGWPAECITFRAIIDPKLPQFKVKGYEHKVACVPAGSGSAVSLQLKPASKSVVARHPETQTSSRGANTPRDAVSSSQDEDSDLHMAAARRPSKPIAAGPGTSDEFEKTIQHLREVQHLPLDELEGDSRPTSSAGFRPRSPSPTAAAPKGKGKLNWQDKFQCMKGGSGSKVNGPNAATIAILDEMSHYYDRVGDQWRTRAYRKAISTLANHPSKVCTKEEALALPQVGERLAEKIAEIASTNRLRRLDSTKSDANDQIFQTFMGVYGAGAAQAGKWVDAGFTTLAELAQKADLTANQRIGIAHYEDFNSRIPRAEVEQLGGIVRKYLLRLDDDFDVIIGGSYRRGAKTSGDVDCITTHKKESTTGDYIRTIVLDRLVPKLKAKDFITADLAVTSRDDGSKWHGACHLPSRNNAAPSNKPSSAPWRRLDLLLVPPAELGAALIYFTGNDLFNRSMRLLASKKGYRLNQRGLYRDVMWGPQRERITQGTLVEGKDERRIFKLLGVPWREAHERNC